MSASGISMNKRGMSAPVKSAAASAASRFLGAMAASADKAEIIQSRAPNANRRTRQRQRIGSASKHAFMDALARKKLLMFSACQPAARINATAPARERAGPGA